MTLLPLRQHSPEQLTTAAADFLQWIAALTGKMGPSHGNGFVLVEPSLQVFERKPKPQGEGKNEAVSVTPPPAAGEAPAPSEAPTPAPTTPTATVTAPAEAPVESVARRPTLGLKKTEQDDVYP